MSGDVLEDDVVLLFDDIRTNLFCVRVKLQGLDVAVPTRLLHRSFTGPGVVVQLQGSQRYDMQQTKALLPVFSVFSRGFHISILASATHTLHRWIEVGMHPSPTPINHTF